MIIVLIVFLNRESELSSLEKLFETSSAKLCRLYGRRRLGKTALLRESLREHGGLFFTIPEQTRKGILHSINDQIERQTGRRHRYASYDDFFADLPALLEAEERLVVLDEFQRLRSEDASVESTLQAIWDNQLQESDILLILCGSVIGMMRALNEPRAPLHGRFAWDLHLSPLSYGAVRLFYPVASEKERVTRYSVFGATPHYHRLAHERGLKSAIDQLFLDEGAPLREEPRLLLELELRKPARYQEILEALGDGCRSVGEIADRYGEPASTYTPYITKLRDEIGILRSDDPLYGKKRNQRIYFSDPFFQFYYRFIYPNLSRLELGNTNDVLKDINDQLTAHAGRPGFEQVGRDLLRKLNGTTYQETKIDFSELGAWWDKEHELDAVAVGDNTAYTLEAKFTREPVGPSTIDRLKERSHLFKQACNRRKVVPIALSRSGFTPEAKETIDQDNLIAITLNDLADIYGPVPHPNP